MFMCVNTCAYVCVQTCMCILLLPLLTLDWQCAWYRQELPDSDGQTWPDRSKPHWTRDCEYIKSVACSNQNYAIFLLQVEE